MLDILLKHSFLNKLIRQQASKLRNAKFNVGNFICNEITFIFAYLPICLFKDLVDKTLLSFDLRSSVSF